MDTSLCSVSLPGITHFRSGKVREVFDLGEALLFVATDRISAFDCIMPNGIPGKGKILTQLSAWWFKQLEDVLPNHVIETDVDRFPEQLQPFRDLLKGRSMIVNKAKVIPVECVARGYLIGSGWKEYLASQSVCGITLRDGYEMADKLDTAIFTPATKADEGHDENIPYETVVEITGRELAERLRDLTLAIYRRAAEFASTKGILLADTKFEFGLNEEGDLLLVDEVLTPDSSRYWPADTYRTGISPESFDKQFVRDYLETLDWDKTPPAPALPPDIVKRTLAKYVDIFERLVGTPPAL